MWALGLTSPRFKPALRVAEMELFSLQREVEFLGCSSSRCSSASSLLAFIEVFYEPQEICCKKQSRIDFLRTEGLLQAFYCNLRREY